MKIAHLSDLHFGTEENKVVEELLRTIVNLAPDLTIISGDFTQVASSAEFESARKFIDTLPGEVFCIPGNHDVPPYNFWERMLRPFERYKRYISETLNPVLSGEQALVLGLNSARRAVPHWNWANGAISGSQCEKIRETFKPDETRWTLATLHHPIHKVFEMPIDVAVFGRRRAIRALQESKVDIVLTGHVHHASITTIGDEQHQTLYLSASTALSSRKRGHENGFNLLSLNEDQMMIDVYVYDGEKFDRSKSYEHRRISSL